MNGVGFLVIIVNWTPCLAKNYLDTAPTNLALNKPSKQSSIVINGDIEFLPSRANDGDLATRGITKVDFTNPSWWFVDLEEQVHVTIILLKIDYPWRELFVGVGDKRPRKRKKSVPGKDFKVCKNFTNSPDDWIQRIQCGFTGRYVIVLAKINLWIAEVEVYNTTEPGDLGLGKLDLARKKSSYLSSTLDDNDASKGNDGNPYNLACTDNTTSPPAYWYVDLKERFQVTSIVLYYFGNWTNLTVGVGDKPPTRTSRPGEDFRVCHVFTGYQDDALQNITCSIPGRYVIIFSNASSKLWLNEIEVYGTPVAARHKDKPNIEIFFLYAVIVTIALILLLCAIAYSKKVELRNMRRSRRSISEIKSRESSISFREELEDKNDVIAKAKDSKIPKLSKIDEMKVISPSATFKRGLHGEGKVTVITGRGGKMSYPKPSTSHGDGKVTKTIGTGGKMSISKPSTLRNDKRIMLKRQIPRKKSSAMANQLKKQKENKTIRYRK